MINLTTGCQNTKWDNVRKKRKIELPKGTRPRFGTVDFGFRRARAGRDSTIRGLVPEDGMTDTDITPEVLAVHPSEFLTAPRIPALDSRRACAEFPHTTDRCILDGQLTSDKPVRWGMPR